MSSSLNSSIKIYHENRGLSPDKPDKPDKPANMHCSLNPTASQEVGFTEIAWLKRCSIAPSSTISVLLIPLDFGEKGVYASYMQVLIARLPVAV